MKKIVLLLSIAVLFYGCSSLRDKKSLSRIKTVEILAVNDIHAAIDKFPRLAFMVDSLRAHFPDMLLLSVGDNQTGNPVNDQYPVKGMPVIELMNALRFNLSAIGNHEFDSGLEGFSLITRKANFAFVCANVTPPTGGGFRILRDTIITMSNRAKLAFTSVLDINANGIPSTHPDNVKGFIFTNPMKVAIEQQKLRGNNHTLIYLNHTGIESDMDLAPKLNKNMVDLIIGGHSHTKIDEELIINDILITQAERYLKYATLIQLKIHPNGHVEKTMKLLTVDSNGNERADIRVLVDRFNDNPVLNEPLATLEGDFTNAYQLGCLMADAMRESSGSDFSLINIGGVRTSELSKGSITVKDVYRMDPFGNETVLFDLTGKEINALVAAAWVLDKGKPLIPSGIHITYILNDDGTLKEIKLKTSDNQPIDDIKIYKMALSSYLSSVYEFPYHSQGRSLHNETAVSMIQYLRSIGSVKDYSQENRVEVTKE